MTSLTGDSKIKEPNTVEFSPIEFGDNQDSHPALKLMKKSNSIPANYDKENQSELSLAAPCSESGTESSQVEQTGMKKRKRRAKKGK